jgi:hypothetical protein
MSIGLLYQSFTLSPDAVLLLTVACRQDNMNKSIKRLLLGCLWLLVAFAQSANATDWQQLTHGGLSFSMPSDWGIIKERELEGQWGIKDDEKKQGVIFAITYERRPERMLDGARKDGMEVKDLGAVSVGELTGQQHEVSGQLQEQGVGEVFIRVVILDGLLKDADRVSFNVSVIGQSADDWQSVIDQVMASVKPTDELVATLTGYSRHQLFDGVISLDVRNNWDMTDYSDNVSWDPPLVRIYGAPFIKFGTGYTLTGEKGLLSKIDNPVIEKAEILDFPAWRITGTGVGVSYVGPNRNKTVPALTELYLSDVCLAKGDRFGYAITGSEEERADNKDELDKLLASMQINLPEGAGSCDELVQYDWVKNASIRVPRSWRKDQDAQYHLSWYDKVLTTGANISLYISHGAADKHPIIGEGYAPAETLETLHIDGYPATHYRKRHTGSDKIESIYDYYVLDTRMQHKSEKLISSTSFVYFKFSTRPAELAEPDTEMHNSILSSFVFGEGWESETPVVRVESSTTVSQMPADEPPMPTGTAVPATDTISTEPAESTEPVVVPAPVAEEPVAEEPVAEEPVAEEPVAEEPAVDQVPEPTTEVTDAAQPIAAEEPVAQTAVDEETDKARERYEQARILRDEGAQLQQQGKLAEAVEKYRGSLELFPDDRLEEHVRRIEQLLGNRK